MSSDTTIEDLLQKKSTGETSVYFLGIGGIGMSALARFFLSKGITVGGYDRTRTALTDHLVMEGMNIHFSDDINLADKNASLVVYTPAIPQDHSEFDFFRQGGFKLCKRSEVLGMITASSFALCVAGTHGKTTTSAMLSHILRNSGFGCNAFLGGIATNYETNFWSSDNNVSVVEADEYDRSFLKLNPAIAIITSMDADHLDIYGTHTQMEDAFIAFSEKIKPDGLLIYKYDLKRGPELKGSNKISYSVEDQRSDAHIKNLKIENGSYKFDVVVKEVVINEVLLQMGGRHNIENTVACIAAALQLGISQSEIKKAVSSFKGVKRRFEYVVKTAERIVIDDYAHHPEELKALIESVRELYPELKCTIVFQPHLFTRTLDFAKEFAQVLSKADEVFLLPIYPAREAPINDVTSELIAKEITGVDKQVIEKEDLLKKLQTNKPALLLIAGAGDIDTMVDTIKNIMQ